MITPIRITATINVRAANTSRTFMVETPKELAQQTINALMLERGIHATRALLNSLMQSYEMDSKPKKAQHVIRQYSDQMLCSCGVAWDVNDPFPPEGH